MNFVPPTDPATGRPPSESTLISLDDLQKLAVPVSERPDKLTHSDRIRAFEADIPQALREPSRVVAEPIAPANATTYGSKTLEEFAELKRREAAKILHPLEAEYVRYGTATSRRVERKLAQLEGGEMALVFPSGMAAIEKVIDALIPNTPLQKAHFIVGTEGYRQTRNILERLVARGWIELSVIPMDHFDLVHEHLKPNTAAIFFETPSNPYLRVIDVANVKKQVVDSGSQALVVVDHTFASPFNQKPLEQGADLVVPSLTKYIGGNNQVLAGAVVGRKDLVLRVFELRSQSAIARDDECTRIEEGLESLAERIELHNRNGAHVAQLLARNPNVHQVWYPGHESHPDHEVAVRQMTGFGGVVTFRLKARDFHDVAAFTNAFVAASPEGSYIAPSFGGEFPLISAVPIVSHFSQTVEERRARNIPDDLVRLSVGTIKPQQLTEALCAGFAALEKRQGLN
jgi:cystathionine gamma-synthase